MPSQGVLVAVATLFVLTITFPSATAGHIDVVAYYPLDEGSGQAAADASGHALGLGLGTTPGADVNDPSWAAGALGAGSLAFASDQYAVRASDPLLEPATLTVEAWIRSPAGYVVSKGANACASGSYAVYTLSGLTFYVTTAHGFFLSPAAPASAFDGDWHHFAGTFDGTHVRSYLDGVSTGPGTPVSGGGIVYTLPTDDRLFVGRYSPNGCGLDYRGGIDEVVIWDRALSPAEVEGRAGGGPPVIPVPELPAVALLGAGLAVLAGAALVGRRR